MTLVDKLANLVFRCWHRRLSLPMSLPRDPARPETRPVCYVVCLDCGKRFGYNLETLTLGAPMEHDTKS